MDNTVFCNFLFPVPLYTDRKKLMTLFLRLFFRILELIFLIHRAMFTLLLTFERLKNELGRIIFSDYALFIDFLE